MRDITPEEMKVIERLRDSGHPVDKLQAFRRKIFRDYDKFIEDLRNLPPEDIIARAYEIVDKNNIQSDIDWMFTDYYGAGTLTEEAVDGLLALDDSLDAIYEATHNDLPPYRGFDDDFEDDTMEAALRAGEKAGSKGA